MIKELIEDHDNTELRTDWTVRAYDKIVLCKPWSLCIEDPVWMCQMLWVFADYISREYHYENMPIYIEYIEILPPQNENFQIKKI